MNFIEHCSSVLGVFHFADMVQRWTALLLNRLQIALLYAGRAESAG
jgi:hypothetical protein